MNRTANVRRIVVVFFALGLLAQGLNGSLQTQIKPALSISAPLLMADQGGKVGTGG